MDSSLDSEHIHRVFLVFFLYSVFQIDIFSNNRDTIKCQKFLLGDDDNDDAKTIAIPRGFSENSRAKNASAKIIDPVCPCNPRRLPPWSIHFCHLLYIMDVMDKQLCDEVIVIMLIRRFFLYGHLQQYCSHPSICLYSPVRWSGPVWCNFKF